MTGGKGSLGDGGGDVSGGGGGGGGDGDGGGMGGGSGDNGGGGETKPLVSSIDTSEVVTLSARTATLMASPYDVLSCRASCEAK